MLTHWVRDRVRGPKLPLEFVVKRMTKDTADALRPRRTADVITPGKKADLNLIDLANLTLEPPRMEYDLPAGGARFLQGARGYKATIVAGEIVAQDDAPTGALPGRLLRAGECAA